MRAEDILAEEKEPEEILKIGLNVIRELERHDCSPDFLKPVPWKKLGLLNYKDVIKRPMDLSTVKRYLK
ncbi:MAG: hypothetical protein V2I33_26320 [Kangiellaceae bacterium]|jgi:hypothetical protein|nr:hypothetical protein [Kangiellaceae bacterium]